MNVNKHTINKFSILSAALGLAVLLGVIVSGAAYPNPFFQFGAPLGLLFVFVSVVLQFISWILEIYHGVKGKAIPFCGCDCCTWPARYLEAPEQALMVRSFVAHQATHVNQNPLYCACKPNNIA